jgi:hypothetical protein
MTYTPESLLEAVRYFSDLRVCNDYMRQIKLQETAVVQGRDDLRGLALGAG